MCLSLVLTYFLYCFNILGENYFILWLYASLCSSTYDYERIFQKG